MEVNIINPQAPNGFGALGAVFMIIIMQLASSIWWGLSFVSETTQECVSDTVTYLVLILLYG